MKQNAKSGFTIVELLIVIVVIAILASISIVSYNGIQGRAQRTASLVNAKQVENILAISQADGGSYPDVLTSCSESNASTPCAQLAAGDELVYQKIPQGARSSPIGAGITAAVSYEMTIRSSRGAIYKSTAERTGINEFMQYMDMAPLIDTYGLREYEISFDIKSANTSTNSTINAYMQNGNGSKYGFYKPVSVTTSYERKTITVTPTTSTSSMTNSVLAFYGTYQTGNIPSVKNVQITVSR